MIICENYMSKHKNQCSEMNLITVDTNSIHYISPTPYNPIKMC